jgi:hypothetical protein
MMRKNTDRVALVRGFAGMPSDPKIDERKKRFDGINDYVTERGGWLISVPGDPAVRMECLPDSRLPNDLRALGYDVREIGDGERILMRGIVERFTRRADGELQPLREGSTAPIAEVRTHAGIVRVKRYGFDMP